MRYADEKRNQTDLLKAAMKKRELAKKLVVRGTAPTSERLCKPRQIVRDHDVTLFQRSMGEFIDYR